MLSNKEIRERVITSFSEYQYTVQDVKIGNSYYLFNLGEESVIHFKIKGCKRWLFGLWIVELSENKVRISLFGEYEDYIDKFKPTQTKLSENVEVDKNISDEELEKKLEYLVWSIIYKQVEVIYGSNIAGKIKFYYPGHENLLKWFFNQWWFYKIEWPFLQKLRYKYNKYIAMVICFILNSIYRKRLNATYNKTDFFFPTYEININYKEGTNDDDIYNVYKHINKDTGFDKSIRINHIPFNEKRSIYFK